MTRKKKTRKTGPLAAAKTPKADVQRKAHEASKHKGKGQKPGSRFNVAQDKARHSGSTAPATDPRLGSKKPIQLVNSQAPTPVSTTPSFDSAAAHAELQALEQDTKLQSLLERMEQGEDLTVAEEAYVDERTERFEQLAEQLGIALDDDEDWEDDNE
ncbi:Der GTPase-activating protein YihI [Pseudidiomarina terrestris]|uniref:GTPase-activating protein n=1 Tax=Pseudidiomarina terrestris TaxID=2820060 RepID=A0AAW7R2T2_9GAMM|nr:MULTISPECIES: Der GTPase-activating protein YihI [unclassified Pseudidiomarina]MDN7125418.1 GTPase-activating protein [Pseudidiomarina sp. 1APP75-32.1]MDN7128022.1 GTPase-activating protein [Pseudidiomarina sp. 1APR75-33.1]MDN7130176.1 GTPase-activating protein [Pseudidiomarina sp. 1APR75-15]MDN7135681.1 GTPase-activating protein [Pseudidiomarina sp. 1ASP75-5]MDN7137281.1 GTPase-activating protein [Pseudidiomarina sp. 1ASP75-14]